METTRLGWRDFSSTELQQLRASPADFIYGLWARHGDSVQLAMPRFNAFLLFHPDAVQHVLLENARNYTKDTFQYNLLKQVTGDGLLTSDGEGWRSRRRRAQPAFHRSRLGGLAEIAGRETEAMVGRWRSGTEIIDISAEMLDLGLRIVVEALFSARIGGTAPHLTGVMAGLLDHVVARSRRLGYPPAWLPVPENRRFGGRLQEIDRFATALITEREQSTAAPDDLLERLLEGQTNTSLGAVEVRNEIVTMLIAGHETVATALAWTWYLLAGSPEVRVEAEREVAVALSSGRRAGVDLPPLPLCSAIFSETLRLYPPAWIISRRARSSAMMSPAAKFRRGAWWSFARMSPTGTLRIGPIRIASIQLVS